MKCNNDWLKMMFREVRQVKPCSFAAGVALFALLMVSYMAHTLFLQGYTIKAD